MSYEVQLKEVKSQPIAAIRTEITIPKLPKKLPRLMINSDQLKVLNLRISHHLLQSTLKKF